MNLYYRGRITNSPILFNIAMSLQNEYYNIDTPVVIGAGMSYNTNIPPPIFLQRETPHIQNSEIVSTIKKTQVRKKHYKNNKKNIKKIKKQNNNETINNIQYSIYINDYYYEMIEDRIRILLNIGQ